ncbi:MAG: type II toxin-antitoxin system VapC family toxin [Candidatus Omnitrophota bacterium]
MNSYLLDSNILIEYLNGHDKIVPYLDLISSKGNCIISIISMVELISAPQLTKAEIQNILSFLGNFQKVDLTDDIAFKAAEIRRRYKLKLPDAVIAATAVISDAILVSGDEVFNKLKSIDWFNPFIPTITE